MTEVDAIRHSLQTKLNTNRDLLEQHDPKYSGKTREYYEGRIYAYEMALQIIDRVCGDVKEEG